jgi:hypothetical protein
MNSSGFTGSGSLNAPNMVYLTSTSGDLTVGTTTANPIHFVVNSGATDAMTIATTGVVSAPVGISSPSVFGKNVLINGDMSISQLNGGTAVTPGTAAAYVLDMWEEFATTTGKLTFQQVTTSLNSIGAVYALKITTATAYTPITSDSIIVAQPIEGSNFDRFFYGSANAKTASLQFKANASIAGTYSGAISNFTNARSYVFTFTLAANTDTLITIPNIPGDTGGTWVGASNAGAAFIKFVLGAGATYQTATPNTWLAGNFVGATGSTNLVATLGATLAISEVQFELGAVCTSFERKLISQSLAECQRYYQITSITVSGYFAAASGSVGQTVYFNPMRGLPTVTQITNNYLFTQVNVSTSTTNYLVPPIGNSLFASRTTSAGGNAQFSELTSLSAQL